MLDIALAIVVDVVVVGFNNEGVVGSEPDTSHPRTTLRNNMAIMTLNMICSCSLLPKEEEELPQMEDYRREHKMEFANRCFSYTRQNFVRKEASEGGCRFRFGQRGPYLKG